MINLNPTVCNLCGGKVNFVDNSVVYGKPYGSGKCYLCESCGSFVGTHIDRPTEALGILANKEMKNLRIECHALFDEQWKNEPSKKKKCKARTKSYAELAEALEIKVEECHFGWFDTEMLKKALDILKDKRQEDVV